MMKNISSRFGLLAGLVLAPLVPQQAGAVPSFGAQTSQPCASCHIGSFGPALTANGREFKLGGYTAAENPDDFASVSVVGYNSFTRTNAPQQGGAGHGYGRNNNPAFEGVDFYLNGRITKDIGSYLEATWDAVNRTVAFGNADIRFSRTNEVQGADLVWGLTMNNNPTVQDLWNSTPAWGMPSRQSPLAPLPRNGVFLEGALAQRVWGLGGYAMWDDTYFLEFDLYQGVGRWGRAVTGVTPIAGSIETRGTSPYWRGAVQKEWGRSYAQIGTFGMATEYYPNGDGSARRTDRFVDVGADFNYQFRFNPRSVTSDMIWASGTVIQEYATLAGNNALNGTRPTDTLRTSRLNLTYSFDATWTPSVQLFDISGSADPVLWGTRTGRANSSGYILEMAYSPWGKPDSPFQWLNVKVAAQYVGYWRFDGTARNAADNNALYLLVQTALRF